jgi:hypothetical protein
MSRNGTGTYNLPAGNPVVTGTTISTTWANTTLTDIGTALTGSVASDGQTPMTGNLNLNSNTIVNLANPTANQDAVTKFYVDTANGLALLKASNLSDVANATTSRTNLSAAKSGANSDITSITGLTTPLTTAQGGTGSASTTYCNLTTNVTGTLPVANGGTGVTTSTGSGANVLGTSPTISGAILSSMASSVITVGTAQASTSGTSIDFTGIPSWVKRITVMFQGVSINGANNFLIQLGTSSGPITSGYISSSVGGGSATSTAGFIIAENTASESLIGQCVISIYSTSSWVASGVFTRSSSATIKTNAGQLTGAGTIDRIRITSGNGTDTFDAGSINILYE